MDWTKLQMLIYLNSTKISTVDGVCHGLVLTSQGTGC